MFIVFFIICDRVLSHIISLCINRFEQSQEESILNQSDLKQEQMDEQLDEEQNTTTVSSQFKNSYKVKAFHVLLGAKHYYTQSTLLNVNTGKVKTQSYPNTSPGHKIKEKGQFERDLNI